MTGNRQGGNQAYKSNLERHGTDFYRRIGTLGGNAPHKTPRGFVGLKAKGQLAKVVAAGKLGGANSHRGKDKKPRSSVLDKQL